MRIFHTAVVISIIAALQVTNLVQPVTAQLKPQRAEAASATNHSLHINFSQATPVAVASTRATFDQAVGAPLRAAQAAQAAQAAAQAKPKAIATALIQKVAPIHVATGDVWEQLRLCEAGGDYAKNTGNGYFGAYQYNLSTWANYGGYARPDLAPPAMQDAKARATQAARGWGPWPACARKLGLI